MERRGVLQDTGDAKGARSGAPSHAGGPPAQAVLWLQRSAGNAATARLVTLARQPQTKASSQLTRLVRTTIDELDDRQSKKVLISAVLAAARLGELPAFTALLTQAKHDDYGNYFIFLFSEMEAGWGSRTTVGLLRLFADAGVDITKHLNTYSLEPLAAVARFKSFARQFAALVKSGDISQADAKALGTLIGEAESALREIEEPPRKVGGQVKLAGGAMAGAAATAWTAAAALAADDVTVIGIADDVAIPFIVIGAATLSAIALFTGGPKPQMLDYGPAKAKVEAALRQMIELVAVAHAMAVQGPRAAGQLGNVAVHLARLLALAAVGGRPSGEPPKKNDRDDKHWWTEIKASLKNFFQATKGASRKQIMRELIKAGFTEAEILEIEAALAQAEQLMGEQIGRIVPPP